MPFVPVEDSPFKPIGTPEVSPEASPFQPVESPFQPVTADPMEFEEKNAAAHTYDLMTSVGRAALTGLGENQIQQFGHFLSQERPDDLNSLAARGPIDSLVDIANKATDDKLAEFGRGLVESSQERQGERRAEAAANMRPGSFIDEVLAGATESAVAVVPSLLVGARNPAAGLGMFYNTAASDAENRALAEGHDSQTALTYGRLSGTIEAGTELLPFGKLLERTPFKKKFVSWLVREMPSEWVATTLDQLNEWATLDKDISFDEWKRRMVLTTATVPLSGGAQVAAANTINRAQGIAEYWGQLNHEAERKQINSEVEKKRRQMITELVNQTVEDAPDMPAPRMVYHGSPTEDIETFNEGYVNDEFYHGSGTDAWGFYFTDTPQYAHGYASELKAGAPFRPLKISIDGQEIKSSEVDADTWAHFQRAALEKVDSGLEPTAAVTQQAEEWLSRTANSMRYADPKSPEYAEIKQQFDFAQRVMKGTEVAAENSAGRVYEVAIPDTEAYLNWDLPLVEQHTEVQEALQGMGLRIDGRSGRDLYNHLREEARRGGSMNAGKDASKQLDEAGIPGMSYERYFGDGEQRSIPHTVYTIFSPQNATVMQLDMSRKEAREKVNKLEAMKEAREEMIENPPPVSLATKAENLLKAVKAPRETIFKHQQEQIAFNQLMRWTAGLLQVTNHPGNANVRPLQQYTRIVQERDETWGRITDRAFHQAKELEEITASPKVEAQVNRLIKLANEREVSRRFSRDELQGIAEAEGLGLLTPHHIDVIDGVFEDYSRAFEMVRGQLYDDVLWAAEDEGVRAEMRAEIDKRIDGLKNQNYLPKYYYGDHVLRVQNKDGEVVRREHFSKEKDLEARERELRRDYPAGEFNFVRDTAKVRRDPNQKIVFDGVPDSFIGQLDEALAAQLEPEQLDIARDEIGRLAAKGEPSARFLRQMSKESEVPGYSDDALRAYTSFFSTFANRFASLKHDRHLQGNIDALKTGLGDEVDSAVFDRVDRTELAKFLERHKNYLRNPGNELQDLRSLGFVWYLGFVPKAALMNMAQVPVVSLGMLGERHGQVAAVRALSTAIGSFFSNMRSGKGFTPQEQEMLNRLRHRVLEENQATMLGAISAGSNLERAGLTPRGSRAFQRKTRKFVDLAGAMFQKTENFNRYITALAAFNLSAKEGKSFEEAVSHSIDMVQRSQLEYKRWNRPEMMRGKASAIFLFKQYLTQMMWMLGTDPSKWRVMAMLFAAAGVMGLPGMENAKDILNSLGSWMNKKAGIKDPKVDIEKDLDEFIQGISEDPTLPLSGVIDALGMTPEGFSKLIMRGASSELPNPLGGDEGIDISGSLSMGEVIPTAAMGAGDADRVVTELARGGLGALGNIPYGIIQAVASDSPDQWKTWEKVLPNFLKHPSRAVRWYTRGFENTSGAMRLRDFDPSDLPAILAQAGGFSPSDLLEQQRRGFQAYESIQFYQGYRARVMDELWKNFQFYGPRSPEWKRGLQQMKQFNSQLPDSLKSLSIQDPMSSIINRAQRQTTVVDPKFKRHYDEFLGSYGKTVVEDAP